MRSLLVLLFSTGCVAPLTGVVKFSQEHEGVRLEGLSQCRSDGDGREFILDSNRPAAVLIHGCNSDPARLQTLARMFEEHGHQTVCFNYDDRDWLNDASQRLIQALELLQAHIKPSEITIFGHSQGGLVARRALTAEREDPIKTQPGFSYRLVTVSTPFGGIAASADCGKVWLHVATLSLTLAVCQAIAGNKWTEVYPGSPYMANPGTLLDPVASHLKVMTDEREECRDLRPDGGCNDDDFVFAVAEQRNTHIDGDNRVTEVTLKAGHSGVIGEGGRLPLRLVTILQQHDVFTGRMTPPGVDPALYVDDKDR